MQFDNQKALLAIGGVGAVAAGVVLALVVFGKDKGPQGKPEGGQPGLELSVNDTPPPDNKKELRCFVDGQFVGEFTLEQCATKNGVSAQSLDVGLDASGALAAAPTASMAPPPALPPDAVVVQPLPSTPVEVAPAPTPAAAPTAGPGAACLRYTGADWRQLSESMSLNGCVQALFAGQCVQPGDAKYGRWGEMTLRLVPRRVEQSNDNQHFRTLVEQRRSCEIPAVRG